MRDEPTILAREESGTRTSLSLRIDPDIIYFNGHFENYPILPGVAQVHWAIRYGSRLFDFKPQFTGMQALKFKEPVLPGAILVMTLDWHPESRQLCFDLRSESGVHSCGRILL